MKWESDEVGLDIMGVDELAIGRSGCGRSCSSRILTVHILIREQKLLIQLYFLLGTFCIIVES